MLKADIVNKPASALASRSVYTMLTRLPRRLCVWRQSWGIGAYQSETDMVYLPVMFTMLATVILASGDTFLLLH